MPLSKRLLAYGSVPVVAIVCFAVWYTSIGSKPGPEFVRLDGGEFLMGSQNFQAEETPVHPVNVRSFDITRTEITNDQFAKFVEETGYQTTAERGLSAEDFPGLPSDLLEPGSMVFAQPKEAVSLNNPNAWWRYVKGASWQHPAGPGSSIAELGDHPVVHVSPEDAAEFAEWIGGRLPTEAEWEFAARGGIEGADYTWGDSYDPSNGWKANTWQGQFPSENLADDGHVGTAPVASYVANGYGLYDMAGNVWEHVADWWVPGHIPGDQIDPTGPEKAFAAQFGSASMGAMRLVKGGSWLCAPNFCLRYRPAARQPVEMSLGSNHVGFRVVRDVD